MEPTGQIGADPQPGIDGRSRRDLLVDHLAELLGTATVYVHDRAGAERLVQDLICEVVAGGGPEPQLPVRVWLQRGLYERARSRADTPAMVPAGNTTDVREALRLLALPERAAVHLVDAMACSYAEVACILGTNVTTAAQALHRGRRMLAERLSLRPPAA